MSTTIRPIETRYRGYRFRSRLEARWAVFFDTLGMRWEYEKEGYDLGADGLYLPDFWLPDLKSYPYGEHPDGRQGCWFEAKATWPTPREQQVAQSLATGDEKTVYVAVGQPASAEEILESNDGKSWPHRIFQFEPLAHDGGVPWDDACWWAMCVECSRITISLWGVSECHGVSHWPQHPRLLAAFDAARGARFEHEEHRP